MAIKMEVRLNEEQIKKLIAPISIKKMREKGINSYFEALMDKHKGIVEEVAKESGYDPIAYGIWDTFISKRQDGFYAIWYRGESCD